MENFQGVAVMNYTDRETPWTRVIEHKHFQSGGQAATYVTKEYPREWHRGEEAYYPVNDQKIRRCTDSMPRWPPVTGIFFSEDVWGNTGIIIWIRSLPMRWQRRIRRFF